MARALRRRCANLTACIVCLATTLLVHSFARPSSPVVGPEIPREAQAVGTPVDGHAPVTVSLIADAAAVTPKESMRVGLWVHLDPGWHIYWQQPGAAGFATQVTWETGDATFGPLQWPAPQVFRESDEVVTYGYTGETLLWANATLSDSVANNISITARLDYLACNIICSPGKVTVRRSFAVGQASVAADAGSQALFARYDRSLPLSPAAAGVELQVDVQPPILAPEDELTVTVAFTPVARPAMPLHFRREPFVPDAMLGLAVHVVGARAASQNGSAAQLMFRGHVAPLAASAGAPPITPVLDGIVLLEGPDGPLQPIRFVLPLPLGAKPVAPVAGADVHANANANAVPLVLKPSGHETIAAASNLAAAATPVQASAQAPAPAAPISLLGAVALALLGGLVLNLMPCVLPVLALKVVGMVHIRQDDARAGGRKHILAHGAAYTGGIVASLMGLASVVCALRAAGTAVGWGFQFQEPWFVVTVTAILVLFALNCFGIFELYVGDGGLGSKAQSAQGLRRSAFDGVLAVILATPCSAPFLGTAVAFALQRHAAAIYLIFTAIGLGLAAPYVVLTALPSGLRFVPRPGNWMLHLKTLLGFGLLFTALWLIWVMGRFVGVDGMAQLLLVLLAGVVCVWIFGQSTAAWPQHSLRNFTILLILLGTAGFYSLRGSLAAKQSPAAESNANALAVTWSRYSPEAVQAALGDGQAVFVDFTADWCLTCKYNEHHVLQDSSIVTALQRKKVVMLRADWTRRDEDIRRTLAHFGRAGVPMYLLFSPLSPQAPLLLPELLSIGQLNDAIGNLP